MAIDFDLSPIPEDADIEEATFSMFFYAGDTAEVGRPNVCSLFTIAKEWDESEVTWNNADVNTKWEMLDLDTKFYNPEIEDTVSTPGGGDYNPGCIAVVDYTEWNTWENYDVTEVIKKAVGNPESFHGFLAKQFLCPYESNHINEGRAYRSSEYDEVDKRPKLTVKYTSSGINTPLYSKSNDNLFFLRRGKRITVFIPFKKAYDVSVFNIQGKKLISLTGCNKSWVDLPVHYLSSGINIVTIKNEQKVISKRFSFIR